MISAPDYRISRIIKGGWQLAGDHGPVDRASAIRDMAAFVDAGITTFDCADIYTGVEEMIGVFLKQLRQSQGSVAADHVLVHTKYVPDATALREIDQSRVEAGIDRSLKRLGVERLDLVQFHWWDYGVPGAVDTLGHLQQLRDKGKIRHIGLTNFDLDHIRQFALRQGSTSSRSRSSSPCSISGQRATSPTFAKSTTSQSSPTATSPAAFFPNAGLAHLIPGYVFENRSLIKYRLIIDAFGGWSRFQELLSVLNAIAKRHDVSIANVALRAMLDRDDLTATILGARYAHHLEKNLKAFAFTPDETDKEELAAVLAKRQGPSGPVFGLERDRTTPHGQIFKKNLNANPADAPA